MTEYLILRSTNESGTIFAIDGEMSASSAETAIRKWAAEVQSALTDNDVTEDEDGEPLHNIFAAVPKRSWTVAAVENEVTTTVKVRAL